jgi:tRNA G18 (ribose-2'-O)-methylase SpoU
MRRNERQRLTLLRYKKDRQRNVLAKPGTHDFCVVLDSLKPSFNVGKIFRSAEAFGAQAVHLIKMGPFDPSPAKGAFRKVPACFHNCFSDCYKEMVGKGYTFFVLDPSAEASIAGTELPQKSAFVFGHEEFGFRSDFSDSKDLERLSIPQFGKVDSLNVSIAASVVMYEYVRQWQSR